MTKREVAKKLNAIIDAYTKQMTAEANAVLKEADMWYGNIDMDIQRTRNPKFTDDRNGDQFVHDGKLDFQLGVVDWLWTNKELNAELQRLNLKD